MVSLTYLGVRIQSEEEDKISSESQNASSSSNRSTQRKQWKIELKQITGINLQYLNKP